MVCPRRIALENESMKTPNLMGCTHRFLSWVGAVGLGRECINPVGDTIGHTAVPLNYMIPPNVSRDPFVDNRLSAWGSFHGVEPIFAWPMARSILSVMISTLELINDYRPFVVVRPLAFLSKDWYE